MIVRRITAGAAGLALVGTAFAAAPAMAKKNTTVVTVDGEVAGALVGAGVTPSAVKPAKLNVGKLQLSIPAKLSKNKKTITHKGGLKLATAAGFVTLENIAINVKNGKGTADVDNSLTPEPLSIKNVVVFKGGKNKIKKKGTWKGASLSLAKSVTALGQKQDPAALISTVLGLPEGSIPTGLTLGKADITVKVKKK